jgi:hypothetical protein
VTWLREYSIAARLSLATCGLVLTRPLRSPDELLRNPGNAPSRIQAVRFVPRGRPRISQELIRATTYNLPRRFDRCAIGAAGKNAILQARACGQFMRQEVADRSEQHYRHERDHRAAAVCVAFVIGLIVHSSRPAIHRLLIAGSRVQSRLSRAYHFDGTGSSAGGGGGP